MELIVVGFNSCQTFLMDKERILAILREHEPELKAAGLLHLRLFGSMARGDNTPASDVDLVADLDRSRPITLTLLSRLEYQLDDLIGTKVDLSSAESMHPVIRARVLREAIDAF